MSVRSISAPLRLADRHMMAAATAYLHGWLSVSVDALQSFDHLDFIIAAAVWNANTRFVNDDVRLLHRYCFEDSFVPFEARIPTSRGAIARFLAMPQETVRRRIDGLIRQGILADRDNGLIAIAFARMLQDQGEPAEHESAKLLITLYDALAASEFALPPADWIERAGGAAVIPAKWIRATTRFSIDFVMLLISEAAATFDVSVPELFLLLAISRWDHEHRVARSADAFESFLIPDRHRKPALAAAARRLSKQSHATARRRLLALEARGLIARAGKGFIVPAATLQKHVVDGGLAARIAVYLRRMFERLAALAEFERKVVAVTR